MTEKFRTQVPNIIDDLGLDPYERALYVHFKKVCGNNPGGYCYETVRTIAQKLKMSTGEVSETRRRLFDKGLIHVQDGRPVVVMMIDIWRLNESYHELEHKPDIDGWTVDQLKEWLDDSHNNVNLRSQDEPNLTEDSNNQVSDVHTVNKHSPSEHSPDTVNIGEHNEGNMSSYVHPVKQRKIIDNNKNDEFERFWNVYETEIGGITKHISDRIGKYAEECPIAWMIEAVGVCVDNNVRKPVYLYSVIENAIAFKMPPGLAWAAKKEAESPRVRVQVKDNKKGPVKGESVVYYPEPPDPIPPPILTPEQETWGRVASDLSPQIPKWLADDIKVGGRKNGTFLLVVSSEEAKAWIDNRLKEKRIEPALKREDKSIKKVDVIVRQSSWPLCKR